MWAPNVDFLIYAKLVFHLECSYMLAIIYNEPLDKRSVYQKYRLFNFPP